MAGRAPAPTMRPLPALLLLALGAAGLTAGPSAADPAAANNPAGSPCPNALRVDTNYQYRGRLHFICLQATRARPRLEVLQFGAPGPLLSRELDDFGPSQLASFVDDDGVLRILVAPPNRPNGTSMYSLDARGRFLDETHTINTQFVAAMAAWRLDLSSEWQLAIANQPSLEAALTPDQRRAAPHHAPMVSLHSWRATYFDAYQLLHLPQDGRVNRLQPLQVNGQDFLLVAMSPHPDAKPTVDSLLYKLDFGEPPLVWTLFQRLPTRLALDARAFTITHRNWLHRDHYIVLLGQRRPEAHSGSYQLARQQHRRINQTIDEQYGLVIYKYFGDQFLHIDSLPAPGASKLDTITYGREDAYVIMATLNQWSREVSLYTFDGLHIRPMAPAPRLAGPPRAPNVRPPRTMSTANLHLFMAPAASASLEDAPAPPEGQHSAPTEKRTLDPFAALAQPPLAAMPTLALSNPESVQLTSGSEPRSPLLMQAADSGTSTPLPAAGPKHESLYAIPVDGLSSPQGDTSTDDQASAKYNKRGSVGEDLLGWCRSTYNSVQNDLFEAAAARLRELPHVNQAKPIELTGNLIVDDDLYISNLLYAHRVEERGPSENATTPIDIPGTDFSTTFNEIQLAHNEIDSMKRQVDQILVDDGSTQDVFLPMSFDELILECSSPASFDPLQRLMANQGSACLELAELRTRRLNNRPIHDLQARALVTGRTMVVQGDVRFEHLILRGSVDIRKTLNGISPEDIVFKRGPAPGRVFGPKRFEGGLMFDSNLYAWNWNGLQVQRQNYLTSSGMQRVDATLRLGKAVLNPLNSPVGLNANATSRIELLNQLHLDAHLDQIALSDADNNFELPLHIDELVLKGPVRFTSSARLASVELEDLWLNTMFKQSNQNVSARMDFTGDVHVSYGGDMVVAGTVNGHPLRPGDILMRDKATDYTLVHNPIIFEHDLATREARLDKALNRIQVNMNPFTKHTELSILYDGGPQLLSADKLLHEVRLAGHSDINGLVNGHLNLTQLNTLATNNNGRPYQFARVRLQGSQVFRVADGAHLHVDQTVNGLSVGELCALANHVQQQPNYQANYKRLKFDHETRFSSLKCASINGFGNIAQSFLTRHGSQHVAGTLRLTNGVLFNTTMHVDSTLNSMPVQSLAGAVNSSLEESRTRHRELYGDLVVDELFAEQINELRLSNVFLTQAETPQLVRAPMRFDHLDIENVLSVGSNLITGQFNGINVTNVLANTLQYDAPQVIFNHVEVNTLSLLQGANLATPTLNGHDIKRVFADAVLVDVPQQIVGPKTFKAPAEFSGRLQMRLGIDGLTEEQLRFNLLLHGDEPIEDDIEFNTDVTVKKELEIQSGAINDVDVNQFIDSMLYENRPNKAGLRILGNGSVRFRDVQLNNLAVAGRIQGLDLSRDAVLRADNQNGSYDPLVRQRQRAINNQRLMGALIGRRQPLHVSTRFGGQVYRGECHLHACAGPLTTPPARPYSAAPPRWSSGGAGPGAVHRPQDYLPAFPPRPLGPAISSVAGGGGGGFGAALNNGSLSRPLVSWQPNLGPAMVAWNGTRPPPPTVGPQAAPPPERQLVSQRPTSLYESQFAHHKQALHAQAIRDLSARVNRYLSVSFFYEIIQKHPMLGPLLHAARDPVLADQGHSVLLLKSASRPGEPCLTRGQSVALMVQERQAHSAIPFPQSSLIQDTSNPLAADSVRVGQSHYLFIVDSAAANQDGPLHQVLVFVWDPQSAMYSPRRPIAIDAPPTALKALNVDDNVACLLLAQPGLRHPGGPSGAAPAKPSTGLPVLHCQQAPGSDFGRKSLIDVPNVFELDAMLLPQAATAPGPAAAPQLLLAALSRQDTEQIGDLVLATYDLGSSGLTRPIASRRLAKPLKLRLLRNQVAPRTLVSQLIVSESITSTDDTRAITRVFSLHTGSGSELQLTETQLIRDDQFYDIQTVALDEERSLLFMQSAHSVAVFTPVGPAATPGCQPDFVLVHRVPSKGANKFLVFNEYSRNHNGTAEAARRPLGHFLVLSKQDCERQQHATIILKARFQ